MQEKLLINQARYVDAGKSSTTVPIDLSTNKDIIVNDQFNDVINQYNVYLDERENCTKIRLIADVNMLASNIVFNSVTEIVKNEGSNFCRCLNYEPTQIVEALKQNKFKYLLDNDLLRACTMAIALINTGYGNELRELFNKQRSENSKKFLDDLTNWGCKGNYENS